MRRWTIALLLMLFVMNFGRGGDAVVAPKPATEACADCRFTSGPRSSTAGGGPKLPQAPEMPRPLPMPEDAIPLAPASADPAIESLVEKHLGNLTPEEQRIWVEELNELPVRIARELLLARERAGGALDPLRMFSGFEPPVQSEPLRRPGGSKRPASHEPSFQQSLDVFREAESLILNNIANAETVGFKRVAPLTVESAARRGVSRIIARRIETQGPLRETGRTLDLALEGPGLFRIERDGVLGLTRRGIFHLNAEGLLATTIGGEEWLLHPRMEIPPETSAISIGTEGTVHCRMRDGGPMVSIGRIELVLVGDFSQLEATGAGLWMIPQGIVPLRVGAAGDAGFATIRSGFVEGSNVKLAEEFAALERVRREMEVLGGS